MNRNWLKDYRKKLHITQEELSARLQVQGFDVTPGAISHWETGRYKPPLHDERFRDALAGTLRVSPSELLAAAGYETEQKYSEAAERAAAIMDQIPEDKRGLALGILEQFLETN